jgi:DNA-binding HxlR family transcriptional regulator
VAESSAARRRPEGQRPRRAEPSGAPAGDTGPVSRPAGGAAPRQQALELDRLIHERMRLAIVSALAVNESLTFNELKQLLDTTDGNLSVHARKLEEARYITCTKTFEGRLPRTEYRLTAAGRDALERYLDHMEALIRTTRDRGAGSTETTPG